MTLWFGIVLGAMTVAATWFPASSADYTGLLGHFQPPDPSEAEATCADDKKSPQAPSYFESRGRA
jgi:hypothetical protein